jgi:hypothetical protein
LKFHQNKCHPRGVPDTRRQCAKAADQCAQGMAGWPNPWLGYPTLQPLVGWLHGDTLQEVLEGNPKQKVGGGQTQWPAGHVARLVGHHLAFYQLNQVSNPPWTPINTPYRWTLPFFIDFES